MRKKKLQQRKSDKRLFRQWQKERAMIVARNQKKATLRRSTSDAIEFLAAKSEKERELKKEELAIKKRELDLAETRQEEAAQQQQTMFSTLMKQMQQQQQLQQQNLQIMFNQQNMVFLTNESANKAEINILSARDTTRPRP